MSRDLLRFALAELEHTNIRPFNVMSRDLLRFAKICTGGT